MEATLQALGGILLRAVPTFILIVLLHFYLKYMFFKPLEKVLDRRYEATEGARKRAEESLERAAARITEYEEAMRRARAEVYQSQEQFHRGMEEQRSAAIQAARESAESAIRQAQPLLAADVAAARRSLEGEADALAERIAGAVLEPRAA